MNSHLIKTFICNMQILNSNGRQITLLFCVYRCHRLNSWNITRTKYAVYLVRVTNVKKKLIEYSF